MDSKNEPSSDPPPHEPTNPNLTEPTRDLSSAEAYDDDLPLESKFDLDSLDASDDKQSLGRLGKYDLLKILGSGGMGVVFQGQDIQLRRVVAVKALTRHLAASPTAKRRFIREARAAAGINHDNVVTIHDVDEHRQCPFLVMELVDGETLGTWIRKNGPLDPVETLRIAAQVSAGLAAAHAQGVIHRDIKPGNILLDHSLRRAKLSDFGLARAAIDNVELTRDDIVVGTPAYMSPEQIVGKEIDPRADLFSLGCVIYAMLVGHSPFQGRTYYEVSRGVTESAPPPLHELDPRIPRFLSELVARLLEKDPNRRPQSAAEVSQVLSKHLAQLNQAPSDRINQVLHAQQTDEWRPAKRRVRWPLAAAILLLAAILSFVAWRLLIAPTEMTVAPDGSGQYPNISAALAAARPDAVIRLVAPGEYAGPIILEGPHHQGISIHGVPGVRISAPSDEDEVVRIQGATGVTLQGLQLDVKDHQIGLTLVGRCDGARIDTVKIRQSPQARLAAVYLPGGSAGTEQAPLHLGRLDVQCGAVGVVIGQDDTPADAQPVEHVELVDSRITGPSSDAGVLLILMSRLRHVSISDNSFSSGLTGISLEMPSAQSAQDVSVRHNAFVGATYFMYAERLSTDQDLTIRNNAVAEVQHLMHNETRRTQLPPGIASNYWETGGSGRSVETAPVAMAVDRIPFLSRDPADQDYLTLPADFAAPPADSLPAEQAPPTSG